MMDYEYADGTVEKWTDNGAWLYKTEDMSVIDSDWFYFLFPEKLKFNYWEEKVDSLGETMFSSELQKDLKAWHGIEI